MADKITKLLAKIPPKHLVALLPVISQIASNDLTGLNIRSLVGHKDLYRVRVGSYRIIFRVIKNQENMIILIAKRDDKTYRNF